MKPKRICTQCGQKNPIDHFRISMITDKPIDICRECEKKNKLQNLSSIMEQNSSSKKKNNTIPTKPDPNIIISINNIDHKYCTFHKAYEPITNFYKSSSTKTGLTYYCKTTLLNQKLKNPVKPKSPRDYSEYPPFKNENGDLIKWCSYHKTHEPLENFGIKTNSKSGYNYSCKAATKQYAKKPKPSKSASQELPNIPKTKQNNTISLPSPTTEPNTSKNTFFSKIVTRIATIFS